MAVEFEFRSGPAYLRFQLAWPDPEIPGYLPTTVRVDTGQFRGSFSMNTWVMEWQHLRAAVLSLDQRVGHDADARADFADEARVALAFKLDRRGLLVVLVDVQLTDPDDPGTEGTELRFLIRADQSYL